MRGKSWRDPNFQFPLRDEFPVVCVSWTDAICQAERQPDAEKPSLDEVTRQIASGEGYWGKVDLEGDPLRDVVLAVGMVRKD